MIHAVDSLRLLNRIEREAERNKRVIRVLIQIKIAEEESKFGLEPEEAVDLLKSNEVQNLKHVQISGLMGMATFTDDQKQIAKEFENLKTLYDSLKEKYNFTTLSMGMSGDYKLAIEKGSTMVRVGSAIFGEREY